MCLFSGGESTQLVAKWLYSGYILVAECPCYSQPSSNGVATFGGISVSNLEVSAWSLNPILISVHVDCNTLAIVAD